MTIPCLTIISFTACRYVRQMDLCDLDRKSTRASAVDQQHNSLHLLLLVVSR